MKESDSTHTYSTEQHIMDIIYGRWLEYYMEFKKKEGTYDPSKEKVKILVEKNK